MKKHLLIILAATSMLIGTCLPLPAAPAAHGGHGGYRGHVGHGWHSWHGRYYGPDVWVGPGWWGPYYPYYPYYRFYTYPFTIAPEESETYAQPEPQKEPVYRYYCRNPKGYYPGVPRCPSGWLKVVPSPPPPAPSAANEELCMALNIEFDTNQDVIKPEYSTEVEQVAEFMKKNPSAKGTIEGHTDNVGSADYNQNLSQRRAESVVKMLVEKYGISKSRLSAKGYGLTRPIADNKTEEGKKKNRRTVANFGCGSEGE